MKEKNEFLDDFLSSIEDIKKGRIYEIKLES